MLKSSEGNDVLLSKVIEYLRFPLIVGVVFIHNYSAAITVGGVEIGATDDLPVFYYVSNLFSQVLARVAVPLFFFISGFLFFYKIETFNTTVWLSKLNKRFKTLLIPYLFWNLLVVGLYFLINHLPYVNQFFAGKEHNMFDVLIGAVDDKGTMTYPLAYQFWFIRDLIVCVVLSPLLYWIVTKTHHIGVILLGIGWFVGYKIPYIGMRGFSTTALFFFSLGAWFSCYRKDLIAIVRNLKYIAVIYPALAIADLLTKEQPYNDYIHNAGILAGIEFCFLLVAYLIENNRIKTVPLLSSASFFIFAIHEPWLLSQLKKIVFMTVHPKSDFVVTLLYFAVVIFVVAIAVGLYYIIKRLMPSFTALITGGR